MTEKGTKFPFRLVAEDGKTLRIGVSAENVEKGRKEKIKRYKNIIEGIERNSEEQRKRLADYDEYSASCQKQGLLTWTPEMLRDEIASNDAWAKYYEGLITSYEKAHIIEAHPTYSIDLEACKCFLLKMADSEDVYIEIKKGKLCVTIKNATRTAEMPLDEHEEKVMARLLGEVL